MTNRTKLGVIFLMALTIGYGAKAQNYTLSNESSSMTVLGTSTLHDWEEDAEQLSGKANIIVDGNKLVEIKELNVVVKVEGLKSEHSGMDSNTYEALNSDKYPNITYVLTKIDGTKSNDKGIVLSTTGNLTISGTTRAIHMDVVATVNGSVGFTGQYTFKMSEFGVEPPTALMGTIKTGDELTIKFDVKYSK